MIQAGTKLGHYEIHFQLGVGGMGEVYRARDSRLNRDVAIKILPQAFLLDPERLARFQREAQVLASLNHPNIAAIYGVEEQNELRGLVLELVEGPTLADRISCGPIPLDEALAMAHKIAEALEAAHERGIVHRDLKPSNVKVSDDGTVKVLDFGLAKVFTDETPTEDFSHSPTLLKATHTGVILGTAAYMSPEQAKGKPVDKRADIWAFGGVLFEMLSGKKAFTGETLTDTLAAVVRAEPNWNDLPTNTPPSIRQLLRRCLTKDPKQRLRDIGDAKYDLESTTEQRSELTVVPSTPSKRWAIPLLVLVLIVTALAVGAFVLRRLNFSPSSAPIIIRFSDVVKSSQVGSGINRNRFALSPDGSKLVYVADNKLHLRSFDTLETKEIPGGEGARGPFFSPDGQSIGFLITAQIKKLPINGGTPVFIVGGLGDVIGASWGRDDTILIGGVYSGILRVPAKGGKAETVVKPAPGLSYAHPQFLPDGHAFLYTRGRPGVSADNELVMRTLENGDETVVARGGFSYRYLDSGHIIYTMGTTGRPVNLMAVAFDINSRKVIGSPVTVVSNVQTSNTGNTAQFSISDTGTLAYMPADRAPGAGSRLLTVSTSGQLSPIAAENRDYSDPRVSPDGHFLAAHLQGDENDIWMTDIARGTLTRLSMDAGEDETPVWSPDGRFVAWSGSRGDVLRGIFRRRADGSGTEELIWKLENHAHVRDWTPDGRALILELADPARSYDIWRLDLSDTPAATPFIQTQFNERCSRLSPDGHWLAYVSDESGRDEIYIQSFPEPGSKLQVSTTGGDQPVWSRHGGKLFFRGNGAIQEITFQTGSPPSVSKARSLFPDAFESPQAGSHTGYDVFPDGRFLMIQAASRSDPASEIVVVVNWTEELKRLIPHEKE
jgi:serine/threonine-protein kinase